MLSILGVPELLYNSKHDTIRNLSSDAVVTDLGEDIVSIEQTTKQKDGTYLAETIIAEKTDKKLGLNVFTIPAHSVSKSDTDSDGSYSVKATLTVNYSKSQSKYGETVVITNVKTSFKYLERGVRILKQKVTVGNNGKSCKNGKYISQVKRYNPISNSNKKFYFTPVVANVGLTHVGANWILTLYRGNKKNKWELYLETTICDLGRIF